MALRNNGQLIKLRNFLSGLRPRNRFLTRRKLKNLSKLEKRVNSDLAYLYSGLHPKHLFYTRHEWVEQFIGKDDIVVDIASGTGCCAYNLAKKCRKVIAMDFQKIQGRFLDRDNLEFHHGDILEILPDLKEDYTFAVVFHILEHLDEPVEFLKKVRAGRIAVIVPHEENWLVSVKKDLGLNWLGDRTHRRLYNHDMLRRHLTEAGYTEIRLMEFDGDNGLRALASRKSRPEAKGALKEQP